MEILKNAKLICVSKHRGQDSIYLQLAFNKYIHFSEIELKWHVHIWKVNFLLWEEKTVAEIENRRAWLVPSVLTSMLSFFLRKETVWVAEHLKICWVLDFRFPHLNTFLF